MHLQPAVICVSQKYLNLICRPEIPRTCQEAFCQPLVAVRSNSINQLMKRRAQSSHARDFLFGNDWPRMRLWLSIDIYLDLSKIPVDGVRVFKNSIWCVNFRFQLKLNFVRVEMIVKLRCIAIENRARVKFLFFWRRSSITLCGTCRTE